MDETLQGQSQVQEAQPDGAMPTPEKAAEQSEATAQDTQGMSERTREQFEKLKRHNEELAAKLAEKESQQQASARSVLDELIPASSEEEMPMTSDYQISEDGTVDVEQLNRALREARELAQKAREEALNAKKQIEAQQRSREERVVHEKFPQLVPGSANFDPDFYKRVKNELIGQMMEGKTDYMNAAETVAKLFNQQQSVRQEVEEKVEEYKKTSEAKQHINAGSNSASRSAVDPDDLARRTRLGDLKAFEERLKRAGL